MIIRKIRSTIKVLNKYINSIFSILKIKLLEENITLHKRISFGKNLLIKTYDKGQIIIEKGVSIEDDVEIVAQQGSIIIKENSFIGRGTQIISKESIIIGNDCLIASYCVIRDNNHKINISKLIKNQGHDIKPIRIGNDVSIGTHCTITAGSNISNGAVVGANSVVTKNVKQFTVVGGVPAKFIKERD